MYSKTILLKTRKVTFRLSKPPYLEKNNSAIFGNPINFNEASFLMGNAELGNKIKGYWLKIDFNKDELKITNDILGGYRVYYFTKENHTYISDDYQFILKNFDNKPIKNKTEYDYWQKHSFTTGQATFIQDLFKISPASILVINNHNFKETTYFKDLMRAADKDKHQKLIHEDLLETFKSIKLSSKKIILLFSGGKDSCLLLQYLLHYNISFIPVFLKLNPISTFGASDIGRVRAISKKLDLKLDEVEINISKITKEEKQEIINRQLFDRHYSLLHYLGCKEIEKKYGSSCLIINGQSSDSILSFGPSEESLMSYFRRQIMYKPKTLISKLGLILLILKTKRVFKLPVNDTERLIALFDEYKYTRVIDEKKGKNYFNYIKTYVIKKTQHLVSFQSKEMYVKILSFSQGSDNQIVINSSKKYNLTTIMPFATPKIIYSTIRYKNESLEIKKPKYVIESILVDEFSFYYKKLKLSNIDTSDLTIDINGVSSKEVNNLFLTKASKIFI